MQSENVQPCWTKQGEGHTQRTQQYTASGGLGNTASTYIDIPVDRPVPLDVSALPVLFEVAWKLARGGVCCLLGLTGTTQCIHGVVSALLRPIYDILCMYAMYDIMLNFCCSIRKQGLYIRII